MERYASTLVVLLCLGVVSLSASPVLAQEPTISDIMDDKSACFPSIVPGPWKDTKFVPLAKYENQSVLMAKFRGRWKWNWETGLYMFRLSYPTYKLFCEDEKSMHIPGTTSLGVFHGWEGPEESRRAAFGEVLESDEAIFVYIRGTINLSGWLKDATFVLEDKVDDFPGRIHKGFWQIYSTSQQPTAEDVKKGFGYKEGETELNETNDTMRKQIKLAVMKGDWQNKPIYIGGHSLGGGLSPLAMYGLHLDLPDHAELFHISQAGPRTGDRVFAKVYDDALYDRTWRMVNHFDPVPKIPWLFGTYQHVGREIRFKRSKAPRDITVPGISDVVIKGSEVHMWAYEDESVAEVKAATQS